ncbi:hypothetical protein NM688_g8258 [Phlebia brevispora]|uniref:Uncharacterized protein n=1 Tax=Phlebia brevispora TaxID=194682 RepID=A0ACC1RVD7_9APHY|nr:hypothetical protein NM688_g8258 [Phlebia brevispora]
MSLIPASHDKASQRRTIATSFGALLVEKLKWIPESIAAMTGLVSAGAQSSQDGFGNVSCQRLFSGTNGSEIAFPLRQTGAEVSNTSEPSSAEVREQHKANMLATYGIKVRDYAYESTLPPVPAYHPPPRPKGPRPLKRTRQQYEEESGDDDDYGIADILPSVLDDLRPPRQDKSDIRPAKKQKHVERARTEPLEGESEPTAYWLLRCFSNH